MAHMKVDKVKPEHKARVAGHLAKFHDALSKAQGALTKGTGDTRELWMAAADALEEAAKAVRTAMEIDAGPER